jgi:hypothetical protein
MFRWAPERLQAAERYRKIGPTPEYREQKRLYMATYLPAHRAWSKPATAGVSWAGIETPIALAGVHFVTVDTPARSWSTSKWTAAKREVDTEVDTPS